MKARFARSVRGLSVLSALALAASAGGAGAADVTTPEEASYASWSGFYVGAYAGAGALLNRTDLEVPAVVDFRFEDGNDGFLYGALLGLNWQVGDRFVLGLQGDIAFPDFDVPNDVLGTEIGADLVASASLRAGFLLTPGTLLYAIGGYSYAQFDIGDFTGLGGPAGAVGGDESLDGFHVGAGVETRLTERLTARLEYRYTDLGSRQILDDDLAEIGIASSMHAGTLGLAYNLLPLEGTDAPMEAVGASPSWTGFYVGVQGGGGALLSSDFTAVSDQGLEQGGEGFLGSLIAGANWQAGESFVLGLEGAIGLADMEWGLAFNTLAILEYDLTAELDWFASASLRAGWLASPETLIYVLGGYSYAEMVFDAEVIALGQTVSDSARDGLDGFHVGAGIEAMLTDSLTARVEYRYTDYGTGSFDLIQSADDLEIKARTHTGTIGLAWLLN